MGRSCPREGSRAALPNRLWDEAGFGFDAQRMELAKRSAHRCCLKNLEAIKYSLHLESLLEQLQDPNFEKKISLRLSELMTYDARIFASYGGTRPTRFQDRFDAEAEKLECLGKICQKYEQEILNHFNGTKSLFSEEKKEYNDECRKLDN